VMKTGGKQYLVEPGNKIKIEKIEGEEGKEITFSEVLLLIDKDKVEIGEPLVKGAKVLAKVLKQDRSEKKMVFRYKSKTRRERKTSHRQPFTQIEILKIES
ncbi:MAG: 50S ribosomal protein L21, partial [Patescibacteria group bacterium]